MAEVVLTKEDCGGNVTVSLNDTIILRLAENATTGYVWHLDSIDEEYLVPAGSDLELGSTAFGGGGVKSMVFQPRQTGTSRLAVKHWREWEGDSSVRERCSMVVEIVE